MSAPRSKTIFSGINTWARRNPKRSSSKIIGKQNDFYVILSHALRKRTGYIRRGNHYRIAVLLTPLSSVKL
jgi:hypothetical protein